MTTAEPKAFELGRAAPGIPVTDIARATRFYQDIFGLEKTFENGTPVGFVILQRDGAEIHLTHSPGHKAGLHNVFHLMVSDANAVHSRCQQLGVPIIKGLRDHDFGLRAFVIADPDGNRMDIGQPLR